MDKQTEYLLISSWIGLIFTIMFFMGASKAGITWLDNVMYYPVVFIVLSGIVFLLLTKPRPRKPDMVIEIRKR